MSDETPEVVELNRMGDKKPEGEEEVAWFTAAPKGHHFNFTLNGKNFQGRELKRETVKSVTKAVQSIQKKQKAKQSQSRKIGLEIKKRESERDAIYESDDPDFGKAESLEDEITELDDKQSNLISEAESLLDEQAALYEKVVLEGLTKWELDEPLNEASIKALSMTARRNIGDEIIAKSVAGGDRVNFTRRR